MYFLFLSFNIRNVLYLFGNMKELNNLLFRQFPGNNFKSVRIFTSKKNPLHMLTLPIKFEYESVLIASIDSYSTSQIRKSFPECRSKIYPFHVVKHLSKSLRMPVVTIVNTFCNPYTFEEIYEVNYYSPPIFDTAQFKNHLKFYY